MNHEKIETNATLLLILSFLVVTIGGLVQVVPLFYLQNTIEKVDGVRPYSPLELAGQDIYIREGCYLCHSQMIRPFRDEVERYGHYSLAAESMFDHPFQWGSERTGPDLARVGGKYSDEWHQQHMENPRSVVPESIMPAYPFLAKTPLNYASIAEDLKTLDMTLNDGITPYSKDQIDNAVADVKAQASGQNTDGLLKRYPKAHLLASNPDNVTELDAVIAYLQVLGTMVDFSTFKAQAGSR